ncbi:2OG-Fe dioxygenase family protein [Vibrio metschnikovii]|uniref:2OG-Fe dioxygenase family protein n=1 Tax=Vibrio metschnikovii TaxID=28172 RepID=UPI00165E2DD0
MTHLSPEATRQLAPSFATLPHTEHADGKYRLRRYSVIQYRDGQVVSLGKNEFVQSEDINHFQGDIVRQFEPILAETLNSEGMREVCELFMQANELPNGQEIEIHQIRVTAIYDETQVAPEGVHQDGFDHIALVSIDRYNIVGGDIMLYNDCHEAPFFRKVLDNGEVAILADSKLWHNASPNTQEGLDVFVLTAKDGRHEFHS